MRTLKKSKKVVLMSQQLDKRGRDVRAQDNLRAHSNGQELISTLLLHNDTLS